MLSVVEAWRRTRALRRRKGRLPSGKWWRRLRVISSPTHFVKNIQEHVNNFTFAWWGDFEQQSCLCAYHGSLQIVKMGRAVGLINVWSGSRGTTRSSDAQTGRLPPGLAGARTSRHRKLEKFGGVALLQLMLGPPRQHPHQTVAQLLPRHFHFSSAHLPMTPTDLQALVPSNVAFKDASSKQAKK